MVPECGGGDQDDIKRWPGAPTEPPFCIKGGIMPQTMIGANICNNYDNAKATEVIQCFQLGNARWILPEPTAIHSTEQASTDPSS